MSRCTGTADRRPFPRPRSLRMRRRVAAVALAAPLAAGLTLLTAPGAAATGPGAGSGKVTLLAASLRGANEVPGPGDPDGRGRAFVRLGGGKACFLLEWSGIGAPAASHIHPGAAGAAGPVAVPFFPSGTTAASLPDTRSSVAGCVEFAVGLALKSAASPRDWYVNIHTA